MSGGAANTISLFVDHHCVGTCASERRWRRIWLAADHDAGRDCSAATRRGRRHDTEAPIEEPLLGARLLPASTRRPGQLVPPPSACHCLALPGGGRPGLCWQIVDGPTPSFRGFNTLSQAFS